MKRWIFRVAPVMFLPIAAALAQSPAYPVKPVRLVVPLAPGGGADTFGRFMAKQLSEAMGQQFIVENRPGGGGLVGGEYAARAAPDGYTLLVGGTGQVVVSLTHRKLDIRKDYVPVTMVMEQPFVLAAHHSLPVKSVADLIKLARARPGAINYGSAGSGSAGHLVMEMFRMAARVEMVHVPYKGAGAAMTDLMAGQVTVLFSSVLGALPVVKAGRVRGLAVSGPRRIAAAPEIPTVAESGLPGFESMFFLGLLGPVGLPSDIVTRLHAATAAILKRRDVQDWFALQGVEPGPGTPGQFAARIRTDVEKIGKVVREAGMKAE